VPSSRIARSLWDGEGRRAVDALSQLMKGEVFPVGAHWEGSPARRVSRDDETS